MFSNSWKPLMGGKAWVIGLALKGQNGTLTGNEGEKTGVGVRERDTAGRALLGDVCVKMDEAGTLVRRAVRGGEWRQGP